MQAFSLDSSMGLYTEVEFSPYFIAFEFNFETICMFLMVIGLNWKVLIICSSLSHFNDQGLVLTKISFFIFTQFTI